MLPPVLVALLLLPLPAFAADASDLRFTDLVTWATLVALVVLVVVAWSRAREWADANLLTSLDLVRRTASPPRIRPWGSKAHVPSLFGERWLEAGRAHWVRGEPATALPAVLHDLLANPGLVVAMHVDPRLVEDVGAPLSEAQQARLFVVQDLPTEHTLSTLALRADLVVVLLDRPIQEELRTALGRWGAVGISVGPDEPRSGGFAAVRSAP